MVDVMPILEELLTETLLFLPRIISAIVIFVATIILAGVISRATLHAAQRKISDSETLLLISRLVKWSVFILGTLVALQQINFDVTSFLAGLGVVGFTVGFAMQDIARNFVAGIILLIRQPFEIGDTVEVGGYTGTVLEVKARDTVIKVLSGEKVIIPNNDVFNMPITNFSAFPLRRCTVVIGLGYGEDVDRAVEVFLQTMRRTPGVLEDPAPTVRAEALGDSALTLTAQFWVNQETNNLLDVHSAVVKAINAASEAEGIDLPYPTQTVRVETL
ncbi:MAG: mechanosensitive ion channel family protein [Anaerolineae bacterium]|nr:mechanosensitive ion channel family protein [Anaerolineae bacterium]